MAREIQILTFLIMSHDQCPESILNLCDFVESWPCSLKFGHPPKDRQIQGTYNDPRNMYINVRETLWFGKTYNGTCLLSTFIFYRHKNTWHLGIPIFVKIAKSCNCATYSCYEPYALVPLACWSIYLCKHTKTLPLCHLCMLLTICPRTTSMLAYLSL